jgi:hypothetical protein
MKAKKNLSDASSLVFQVNEEMEKQNLILVYIGDFSQSVSTSVLHMAESNFNVGSIGLSIKKKLFNIMVESLQNICKHSKAGYSSVFMIGENEDGFTVISGNPINHDKIELVIEKIDQVNNLGPEGLKVLYKEVRLRTAISDVGGAGLGFIDMARKSGNKLKYHFSNLTTNTFFFTLSANISKKDIND